MQPVSLDVTFTMNEQYKGNKSSFSSKKINDVFNSEEFSINLEIG